MARLLRITTPEEDDAVAWAVGQINQETGETTTPQAYAAAFVDAWIAARVAAYRERQAVAELPTPEELQQLSPAERLALRAMIERLRGAP